MISCGEPTIKSVGANNNTYNYLITDSPGQINQVVFRINAKGQPTYQVYHQQKLIIAPSALKFEFNNQPDLGENLKVIKYHTQVINENYEIPWGEQRMVNNHYRETRIELAESKTPFRKWNLFFRVYDDGIALRHEFPKQDNWEVAEINEERTEFNLTEDPTSWWIPGDWDIYEHLYNTSKVSEINALSKRNHPSLAQSFIPENAVNTPFTMRYLDGTHLSFHEASLIDYSGMTVQIGENNRLFSNLVGSENTRYKVIRKLPFKTPWRSITITDQAKDLIGSNLILNLNEPNVLEEIPFKPMKYVGIWWEMHIGKSTWDYAGTQDAQNSTLNGVEPLGNHGATTENTKKYIDFAAQNGFGGVLVEGWNTGWERWNGFEDREGVFDFITPYPDYDLSYLSQYAQSKNVELIMHHETSAAVRTYEEQLDAAYELMNKHGMSVVKTGYVGKIIPKGEYHHGQYMVNHYQKVVETAAKYGVSINAHEPIKGTGLRRTYPNFVSREGLRGQEFNAWASEGGNPPEHLPIVAFTRMLSGPIDFTPGVFDIMISEKPDNRVHTTLAQQLALYVIIYSPIQMACDLPERYEANPGPFQFIKDVGVDWEQTKVLAGEVGDFVVIAREEKNTGNWFVGGITDEIAREFVLDFDFLDENESYEASIYYDAEDADWETNPLAIEIERKTIKKGDKVSLKMASGGGFAVSLKK